MTFGFAPGYIALTTTVGGVTCGYSVSGSPPRLSAPAIMIIADSTTAAIGLSMKKRERFIAPPPQRD
jgi:hypothetical protein